MSEIESIPVSSDAVAFFLREVGHQAGKLRDNASYLVSAGKETLSALADARLPAWALNHQAVKEIFQTEGALRALRNVRDAVCVTDGDKAAFDAILARPDRQYFVTVVSA